MYDLNVGIVVIKDGLIFVGRRTKQGTWQMPQGNIDEGETPFNAAVRELKEEIGVTDVEWLGETSWNVYDFPESVRKNKYFAYKKGKKQKWFYCALYDEKQITLNEEFSEYKWEADIWVKNHIVHFKRSIYKYVFENSLYQNIKLDYLKNQ